jgi:Protein of unknown function (DUF4012)
MPDPPIVSSPVTRGAARGVPAGPRRHAARRRLPRLRWVLFGAVLLVLGLGIAVADAYVQAFHAAERLRDLVPALQSARQELLRSGGSSSLDRAEAELRDLRSSVDGARFTFGLTGALPFLGRPVDAVRLGSDAASEVVAGLEGGRDLVRDVTGGPGGSGLLHDGTVDLRLVGSLRPRVAKVVGHLEAARRELLAIPSVPFVHEVARLKADALAQADEALSAGRRALDSVQLLPSLLGADGPRTYFLALQNNADLRGTGGAVLAWGLLRVADGKISLVDGGPVTALDQRRPTRVDVADSIRWFLKVTHRPALVNNGMNYTPDFPVVAQAWAKQLEQLRGDHVDGVIAVDPAGAAALFHGQRGIRIPASPDRLTSHTIAAFAEHGQYSLPKAVQQEVPKQLISAAFAALTDPRDLLAMSTAVSGALAEKRIQLWLEDPKAQRIVRQMGWDGALQPGRGDYLFLVDNKRNANKVDYFGRISIDYTIRIDPNGDGHATADITLDDRVPKGEPPTVVGPWDPYGLNVAMLSLYVPAQSVVTSFAPTTHPDFNVTPKKFLTHQEAGLGLFARVITASPGEPGTLRIDYDIPGLVTGAGPAKVYRLTVQHQPMVNPAKLSVTLQLPEGSTVTNPGPGWKVHGNQATLARHLDRDLVTSLAYR